MAKQDPRHHGRSELENGCRALARCRELGYTPVVMQVDTDCGVGRAAVRAFGQHRGYSRGQLRALLRREAVMSIIDAETAMELFGAIAFETLPDQWASLSLNLVAQELLPDAAALLRLPIPAPWFFLVIVANDRMLVTVSDDLADRVRASRWQAEPPA